LHICLNSSFTATYQLRIDVRRFINAVYRLVVRILWGSFVVARYTHLRFSRSIILPLREIFDVEKTYDRSTLCLSVGLVTSAMGPGRVGASRTVCWEPHCTPCPIPQILGPAKPGLFQPHIFLIVIDQNLGLDRRGEGSDCLIV
jgi:hypothetical protein